MFDLHSFLKLSCLITVRMFFLNTRFDWLDGLISFLLHLLEQFLVIWEPLRLNDLFYLSLHPSANHSVYSVLLSMNIGSFWLLLIAMMDFGVEGKLVDWFLVLYFWGFFISPFLVRLLSRHFVEYLWSTIPRLGVGHLFGNGIVCCLLIIRFLEKLIIASLSHTSFMGTFTLRPAGSESSTSLRNHGTIRILFACISVSLHSSKLLHSCIP